MLNELMSKVTGDEAAALAGELLAELAGHAPDTERGTALNGGKSVTLRLTESFERIAAILTGETSRISDTSDTSSASELPLTMLKEGRRPASGDRPWRAGRREPEFMKSRASAAEISRGNAPGGAENAADFDAERVSEFIRRDCRRHDQGFTRY